MPINGSEFADQPWNTTFSPFTDLFGTMFYDGNIFYIIPIIALAFGIYIKTQNPVFASMFIVGSGGILSMATFLSNQPNLSMMFTLFTAIGISIVVSGIILQKKG